MPAVWWCGWGMGGVWVWVASTVADTPMLLMLTIRAPALLSALPRCWHLVEVYWLYTRNERCHQTSQLVIILMTLNRRLRMSLSSAIYCQYWWQTTDMKSIIQWWVVAPPWWSSLSRKLYPPPYIVSHHSKIIENENKYIVHMLYKHFIIIKHVHSQTKE